MISDIILWRFSFILLKNKTNYIKIKIKNKIFDKIKKTIGFIEENIYKNN